MNSKPNIHCVSRASTLPLCLMVLLAGTTLCYSQKGFHMDEKRMVENYKRSSKFFETGKELFKKKKLNKAKKELIECLSIFPQHDAASYYLSSIHYDQKDFPKALEFIQQAKENFKKNTTIHAYAHQTYLDLLRDKRSSLQDRVQQYQDQLNNSSLSSSARQQIQASLGLVKQNISQIDSRLSNPTPPVHKMPVDYFYLHGNILFKIKKFQEAFSQYLEALKTNPKHGPSYNNLANLYFMGKRYQQAYDFLIKAEENGVKVNLKFKKAVLKALGK